MVLNVSQQHGSFLRSSSPKSARPEFDFGDATVAHVGYALRITDSVLKLFVFFAFGVNGSNCRMYHNAGVVKSHTWSREIHNT